MLSQLLAEFAGLPLLGFKGRFGIHQLVQLLADSGHVELGGLALLPQGSRLHPQLRGGHGELLAALPALHLHPLGVGQQGLHAHCHRLALITRHVLDRDRDGWVDGGQTAKHKLRLQSGFSDWH